jgi:hypothetical protein
MSLSSSASCAIVTGFLVAGCAGDMTTPIFSATPSVAVQSRIVNGHFVPHWSRYASVIPDGLPPAGPSAVIGRIMTPANPESGNGGIYVSEYGGNSVYGYPSINKKNGPPICTEVIAPYGFPFGDLAVDAFGNLLVPFPGYAMSKHPIDSVYVYKGPGMCGAYLGGVYDSYGQPYDAAAMGNASSGVIAIATLFDTTGAGSITVCTLSAGCTANLTNPKMYEVAGVAISPTSGDCWAAAVSQSGVASLTYFKRCSGNGISATGFRNKYYGGMDIDRSGNLISISAFDSRVYVYKGCKPSCALLGGPFTLRGEAVYGHLNHKSTEFATGNIQNNEIDVYSYSPTGIRYQYSFNNGLAPSLSPVGVAYNPRSKE